MIRRRTHDQLTAALEARHAREIARVVAGQEHLAAAALARWLTGRARAYDLDAEHLSKRAAAAGRATAEPGDVNWRRVLANELRDCVRDIRSRYDIDERTD